MCKYLFFLLYFCFTTVQADQILRHVVCTPIPRGSRYLNPSYEDCRTVLITTLLENLTPEFRGIVEWPLTAMNGSCRVNIYIGEAHSPTPTKQTPYWSIDWAEIFYWTNSVIETCFGRGRAHDNVSVGTVVTYSRRRNIRGLAQTEKALITVSHASFPQWLERFQFGLA